MTSSKLHAWLVTAVVLAFAGLSTAGAQPAAEPQPGDAFSECRNCPEMVVLPAGQFLMGSPEDQAGHRSSERQTQVTFERPFAISRTSVTWDQWEACVRDRWCDGIAVETALRSRPDGTRNPDFVDFGRGTRPVIGVSWYDAQHFVGWLNHKAGVDDLYRMPSDAEWEYAARGGTTTVYWWGDELDFNYGNFGNPGSGLGGHAEGRDIWENETAPVGSFPANPFGLYDMHGNVFEWVEDCFQEDRAGAPSDGSANKQGNCANRVFRNGTFLSNPAMHRSARRGAPYENTRRGLNYIGFRVARTLE